ncbi:MAG: DNA repair protein RecO [Gammaproteobacteria bacterium]|nr:DNA repair protein RecO [Gammaproteobacteria bacterium]
MVERSRYLMPAFVLHRRAYSNHSLLVELFTPDQGRFPAIARGIMKRKRQGSGVLQSFLPVLVRCSGRGEVRNLNEFESAGNTVVALQGRALYCGFYLNELLIRLLPRDDPHQQLFQVYGETLNALVDSGDIELVLRRFEVRFLEALGFGLILDRDTEMGEPLKANQLYDYPVEHGPVATPDGFILGSTLLALGGDFSLDSQGLRQARTLTRRVLAHYLGGRPLKSRELFRSR